MECKVSPADGSSCWWKKWERRNTYENGNKGDDESGNVAEHVEAVGDQGHGVGHVADDDLDEEVARRQQEHAYQPRLVAEPHRLQAHLIPAASNELPSRWMT